MPKNNNKKRPKNFPPPKGKENDSPRSKHIDVKRSKPVWVFRLVDIHAEWSGCDGTQKHVRNILEVLSKYETMVWGEIESKESHSVPLDRLTLLARKRLEILNVDDVSHIFSLRVNATQRLWGIRQNEEFRVLWWDPQHEVCESKKKHT